MEELRKEYIDLILKKCIYANNKALFISYEKSNILFIKALIKRAKELGFEKFLIDEMDITLEHRLLKELSIEEIQSHPYFYNPIWNEAVQGGYSFLLASTTFPNYLDDIETDKIVAANQTKSKAQAPYIKSVMNDTISWTIFGLPSTLWAENLFPNDIHAYEKLEKFIYSSCMIGNNDSIEKWNHYIHIENKKVAYLNKLNIKEIILKNNLGTNLKVGLANHYIFRSLENNHCIENMPTYSIWTAPHKYIADGIVYGSMPITYRNYNIEGYWFQFSNGKVTDYDAKIGKQYLDEFFSRGDSCMRLGEIAIIDFDSPISRTKRIYNNNLFDENVSTHLALGCAYQNTIQDGIHMSEDELDKSGCNVSPEHMDFTVGTQDLQIIARTYDGKELELFQNGNFHYELIDEVNPFQKHKRY